MEETYCGKTCADCPQREALSCPGCKAGPGGQIGGCALARCVREKGHVSCATCSFRGNCGNLRHRDQMPEDRRRKQQEVAQRRKAMATRAPILGKWLWILFWLFLPEGIGSLMTNDNVLQYFPELFLPGTIWVTAVVAAQGLILLGLAAQEEGYRRAGICRLVACGINLALAFLGGSDTSVWRLLLSVPGIFISLDGQYHEFFAHSAMLQDLNSELSEKWQKLWKWTLGSMGLMLGSILVVLIIPVLGALLTLAGSIGVLVTGIMRLAYLCQTAQCFRSFLAVELENQP